MEHKEHKIEVKNLSKMFGPHPKSIKKYIDQVLSKEEI